MYRTYCAHIHMSTTNNKVKPSYDYIPTTETNLIEDFSGGYMLGPSYSLTFASEWFL